VTPLFAAIGRFSVRFRYLVVVVWLVGTGAAVALLPGIGSVAKANNSAFLPTNSPSNRAAALATPFESSNVEPAVVVIAAQHGTLGPAALTAVDRVQAAVGRVSGVADVRDLGISADGAAVQLRADIRFGSLGGNTAEKDVIEDVRSAVRHAGLPSGVSGHVTGPVAIDVDSQTSSSAEGSRTQTLSIIFVLVLLLLVFRALLAPVLTLLPAVVALELAQPLIAESSKVGVQVSSVTRILLIVLMIGAGTDYGLFLVFRVREELRSGQSPGDAIARSVARVGESITFSGGTVIVALLSLLLASFGIYRSLGIPLAIGIACMLLAGLTLLPALLAVFGRAVFWPSNVKPGPRRVGVWGRVAGSIVQRPAATLCIGLVFFGALALGALGYSPSGFGGALVPPPGSDSARGQAALAAHFPKASSNPTNLLLRFDQPVWAEPSRLAVVSDHLMRSGQFRSLLGPLDPNGTPLSPARLASLHALLGPAGALPPVPPPSVLASGVTAAEYNAYRATSQLISADGRTVQFEATLTAGNPASTEATNAVPAIRAAVTAAAHAAGASASGVAGEAPVAYDVSAASGHDLRTIVPIAVLFIAVLLALVMRSLVAPLYLIASVVLSYLAALGLAVIIFIDLAGQNGLSFILPFLMFVFLLALGEDYNILVMSRIREEAQELPLRHAITRALGATGTTVTSAGMVLAGTFAVLVFSAGNGPDAAEFRAIGAGLALGILMDSFLVRTLLVPSVVALLGRFNWWPSRLSRPAEVTPAAPVPTPAGRPR
jgi:putative drug exporter of the RND superfamily